MQAQTASGWTLVVVASLLALAACTNSSTSASGNAAVSATRMAGSSGQDSVAAVSDALGQRLDNMLSARQASH